VVIFFYYTELILLGKVREKRVFFHSGKGKSGNVRFEKLGEILKIRSRKKILNNKIQFCNFLSSCL